MYCKEIRKKGIVLSLTQGKKSLARRNTLNRFLMCERVCVRGFVRVMHVCGHAAIRACLHRQYVNVHYRSNES